MKISYKLAAILLIGVSIISCKKVIELNLGNTPPQLVIEGNLTDARGGAIVTISQSVAFDNTNTFPPVSGAIVKVIDYNGTAHNFTERTPGTYSSNFAGAYESSYTLQVQANGQTYTAVSTMPYYVNLDSLSVTEQGIAGKTTKTIAVYYQDPPNENNQYRLVMTVNGVEVNKIFTRNDQFSDGRAVQALLYEDDITLKTGDNVIVEMQCIDPTIYTYWNTLSKQQENGFNNSATPSNPPNNFTPNVLGYFSAHTSQRRSIIIP